MSRPYIPVEVARRVREAAQNRCGYCLSPQRLVMARLEIEHIIPLAKGGNSNESNLWLACPICNSYKADKTEAIDPQTREVVPLYNPRSQVWAEHFRWFEGGLKIEGLTAVGRATVAALRLNEDLDVLTVRSYWILAGWHPPEG
ncbi:MAG: HNH endonuclease signature motif containing protein [Cyanobacteriota bacterium]|nr:HNH endonuclease signature motif containing protein [Cyanobacteriota bacterium]